MFSEQTGSLNFYTAFKKIYIFKLQNSIFKCSSSPVPQNWMVNTDNVRLKFKQVFSYCRSGVMYCVISPLFLCKLYFKKKKSSVKRMCKTVVNLKLSPRFQYSHTLLVLFCLAILVFSLKKSGWGCYFTVVE